MVIAVQESEKPGHTQHSSVLLVCLSKSVLLACLSNYKSLISPQET